MVRQFIVISTAALLSMFIHPRSQVITPTPPPHSVSLEYAGAGNADIYRADGGCATASTFTKLAVNQPPPYLDLQVSGGDLKCYYIITNPANYPAGFLEAQVPMTGSTVARQIPITINGQVQ